MSEPRASRPTAPDWVGGDELLPWSWAVGRLTDERNYWLSSVRRDGFPQARPLWGVWHEDVLFLSVGHAGLQRADRPGAGGRPVTAHVDSAVDVVIIEGMIHRVAGTYGPADTEVVAKIGDAVLARAGELYKAKYDYDAEFVNFALLPRVVYGWRDEDVKTATKWTFH